MQCGETVLAVDDQELPPRLLEIADVLESSDGLEVEALSLPVRSSLMLTFAHSSTSRTYLDDENTTTLPGVHLFDVGLRLVFGSIGASIRVENLADKRGAMLGFLLYDPTSMRNVPMVCPMGGRTIRVALKVER